MNAEDIPLGELTETDQAALDALAKRQDAMLARTIAWSKVNTGSWNAEGLNTFAPMLAEAFAETEAAVELIPTDPIENIKPTGEVEGFQTGPVLRAVARPDAPNQVVMTGHYDTVFPKGTFTEVTDLGGGKWNGPGLTDMKGGICVMLEAIKADGGDTAKYIAKAKDKSDPFKLMGFGHRVYKNFDPRAKVIKVYCDEVLEKLNVEDPLLDIAKGLEKTALSDEYFAARKLFPNVDFYSGIIYKALGIPTNMFTVMFAVGRQPGWICQWKEMIEDPSQRIGRPRQLYTGATSRDYVDIAKR